MYNGQNTQYLTVAKTAPTGIAANNIHGVTLHKFAKLIVKHSFQPLQYWDLNNNDRKYFKQLYSKLKMVIIGNNIYIKYYNK